MVKVRKEGSILIRSLFFVVIIFTLSLAIFRFQNLNLRSVHFVLITKKITNYIDVIKNELYFNKQNLYIGNGIYIREENLNLKNYKEFNEIFENNVDNDENYFYLESKSPNVINITYFYKQKSLLSEEFEI